MIRFSRILRNIPLEFDAIVVGGGTSGCLIAGRLAQENLKTLVLEAGSDIRNQPEWHRTLPASQMLHRVTQHGYENLETVTSPQQMPDGSKAPVWIPTPCVLGGHGVMGGRAWNLGDAGDWKASPWDFKSTLLPRIRAFENMEVFAPHRGKRGKFLICSPITFTPYYKPFCEAISQDVPMLSEFTKRDFNLVQGCGRPDTFVDQSEGKAHSTLQRYVIDTQKLKRPLYVRCSSPVVGISAGETKSVAGGVTVKKSDGTLEEFRAPIVVVSAGTIGSAKLLAASRGSIVVDKSVGNNFWDIPQIVLQFRTKDRMSLNCLFDPLVRQYLTADLKFSKPILNLKSSYDDLVALWGDNGHDEPPQATIHFQPFTLNNDGSLPLEGEHGCQFVVRPFRVKSRGSIGADGVINPNYFSEAADLQNLLKAVNYIKNDLVKKKPFAPIIGDLVAERVESSGINGGSCASVVNPNSFQLKGSENVYLCDGSIIPNALTGSTLPYKLALADMCVDNMLKKKDVYQKVKDDPEAGATRIVY